MIVALTGTPGTGKTSVSKELGKQGFAIVDMKEFIEEQGIGSVNGKEIEVRVEELVEHLENEFDGSDKDIVIEGHLSHHYETDYCVVLRCSPDVLEERLSEREYNPQKVRENVEAESLDIILQEAVNVQENIIEVDTTGREAGDVAEEVKKKIENDETGYGEIDWTEFL